MRSSGLAAIACSRSSAALRWIRWVISSAIDQVLVDGQRPAVHLGLRQRAEHSGQWRRVPDGVREHAGGAAALVARQPAAVDQRVGLDLAVAEDELDALAGPRVRDGVAAALEAEQP